MPEVTLVTPKSTAPSSPPTTPLEKVKSPKNARLDAQINASGRRQVGENAYNKAVEKLKEFFAPNKMSVSSTLDARGAIKSVSISDSTGKTLIQMPPTAAIAIAEKARDKAIGLIIDGSV